MKNKLGQALKATILTRKSWKYWATIIKRGQQVRHQTYRKEVQMFRWDLSVIPLRTTLVPVLAAKMQDFKFFKEVRILRSSCSNWLIWMYLAARSSTWKRSNAGIPSAPSPTPRSTSTPSRSSVNRSARNSTVFKRTSKQFTTARSGIQRTSSQFRLSSSATKTWRTI